MVVLVFTVAGKVDIYIRVADDRSLTGCGPGTDGEFWPLERIFRDRESLAKVAVVKRMVSEMKTVDDVKQYVVSEFAGKGLSFTGELPDSAFAGVSGA